MPFNFLHGHSISRIRQSDYLSPDNPGICFAMCQYWVELMRTNKRAQISDGFVKKWLKDMSTVQHSYGQDLLESQDGKTSEETSMTFGKVIKGLVGTPRYYKLFSYQGTGSFALSDACKNKKNSDYFGIVGMQFTYPTSTGTKGGGHSIAVKFDHSSTGGWLNLSYPCAMFDPNCGDAKYNNEKELIASFDALTTWYWTDYQWKIHQFYIYYIKLLSLGSWG